MSSESIDDLLARYLGLLHEYTRLRALLSSTQSRLYGHLARANFAAERGFRYGRDHYDGRMQAAVQLSISPAAGNGSESTEEIPSFRISRLKQTAKAEGVKDEKESQQDEGEKEPTKAKDSHGKNAHKKKEAQPPRDPLQWFGVLTPMALRQTQGEAMDVIDNIVPQLASISAEMAAVEIEVRRARKKRAQAAAAQVVQEQQTASTITARTDSSKDTASA